MLVQLSNKCTKAVCGENKAFSIKDVGTPEYPHGKEINFGVYFISYTKIDCKWIKDLNADVNTNMKLLEENLCDPCKAKMFKYEQNRKHKK